MYVSEPPPAPPAGEPASRWPAWARMPRNVWAIGLTSLLTDISSEMVTSALPVFVVVHLQWSPMVFGAVDGAYQGVATIVRLFGGVVADRWRSHKAVAVAGYALSAVAKLGYAAAGAVGPALGAALVADRLGKGLRTAPRDALIAASAPPGRLGAAFGLHRTMDALGAASGPALVFLLLAAAPGRFDVVFVTSFWLGVVGVAAIAVLVDGRAGEAGEVRRVAWARLGDVLQGGAYRGVLIAALVLALVTVGDGFLYLVLQRRSGFEPAWVPLLFVGTQLTYFALAAPSGALVDRRGARPVFLLGHLSLAGAYAWLAFAPAGAWAAAGTVVLLGAYYAATDGVLSALATRVVPPDLRGTALGLLTTGTTGGRALAALAFGGLWAVLEPVAALTAFLAALVAALAVAARVLPAGTATAGGDA